MADTDPPLSIPTPAHPHRRREPLPWHQPKPIEEDSQALSRVRAIMDSPTYQLPEHDKAFLDSYETRGLRLHVDYLKPELLLEDRGIKHTIVVFGSTRIAEPAAAQRRLAQAEAELAAAPEDAEFQRRVRVAKRLLDKSHYYDIAREIGQLIGNSGEGPQDSRVMLMTGGGPGMMEAANRGAFDVGASSVGLNINLPHEQYPNPYITPDLCFRFHYFAIRKLHFLLRARALVALPGGFGTFDELFETLTLVQTRKIAPVPVVLVGEAYWRRAFDIDFLIDEGVIDAEDGELFWYAETAQEAWDGIRQWHEVNGKPLF